jgi:hypothetical protein
LAGEFNYEHLEPLLRHMIDLADKALYQARQAESSAVVMCGPEDGDFFHADLKLSSAPAP